MRSLQDDVVAWFHRVEAAQSTRNRIVHSHWASKVGEIGPAAIATRVGKPSKGLQRDVVAYTADEIRAAAGECTQAMLAGDYLVMELQEFAHAERLDPSRDTAPWTRASDSATE